MKAVCIQMSVVEGDKGRTIDKAARLVRQAKGADLIMLPEIWNVGFMSFDRYLSEAEEKDGPTLTMLRGLARETAAYLHTGSFVEQDGDDYYNSSYLISPQGELLANYRKIHLFGYNSQETQLLTSGREVVVVDTPWAKFGLATCFDLRFPELFRKMVDLGAEVFLICSAWPYPRLEAWLMLNRVRALENQCFLLSANSCGPNMAGLFCGHSMMSDPWGVILAGGGDEETLVKTDLDLGLVKDARDRFPGLAGRLDWLINQA